MKFPFHGVQVCGDVLFATRAGNIDSFKLSDGSHISCWKYPVEPKDEKSKLVINVSDSSTPTPSQVDQGPPAKRVKLGNGDAAAEEAGKGPDLTPSEVVNEETPRKGKKNKKHLARPAPLIQPWERPMVIIMTATQDDSHLVAVTSDKSVWVFEHDGQGLLKQLSRRRMPKRPCSIVLTPDSEDILVADKFGDIYSLPLIPAEQPTAADASPGASSAASPPPPATSTFTPQASELTVHTKRNRQALLDQVISRTNPKAQRGTPRKVDEGFERHLLLGHVSLLTAVALGFDGQGRRYIITADRDEHIRVSRGTQEQAHVIESFCLGHEEFVSRLCVPEGMGDLLVSAGGDPEVLVWKWKEGRLVAKAGLLALVNEIVPEATKVAVTGLWAWPGGSAESGTRIVVICERIPALFLFTLQGTGSLTITRAVRLPGNPLDVGVVDNDKLVVAVDQVHKEVPEHGLEKYLLRVESTNDEYQVLGDLIKDTQDLNTEDEDIPEEELQRLLYSAETLRKLESADAAGDAGGDAE